MLMVILFKVPYMVRKVSQGNDGESIQGIQGPQGADGTPGDAVQGPARSSRC